MFKLKSLNKRFYQAIITSPPYFQCRTYKGSNDKSNQDKPQKNIPEESEIHEIGQEPTPDEYIKNLCKILEKSMKYLKDDGVMWVVIGDSIAKKNYENIKKKESIGIPWKFAEEMRSRGYYIRQELIWKKLNPIPNSVKDMCVPCHESIFLITKAPKYFFDVKAIEEEATTEKKSAGVKYEPMGGIKRANGDNIFYSGRVIESNGKRRKRDVWDVPTAKCKISHAAAYPIELIEPCVLSSTKKDDWILDPFSGTGTTGVASLRNKRNYTGIEKNGHYNQYAIGRLEKIKDTVNSRIEVEIPNRFQTCSDEENL